MLVCPVPKISQVMMKSRRRASHRGRFKCAWHNGPPTYYTTRRATQFSRFTLLRNGRRAKQPDARTSSRTHFQRTTQRKLLKYVRVAKTNSRPQETFEKWTPRTLESPHDLARQCEAIRKQSPQIKANVCRHKCMLEQNPLYNCTGQSIMQRTPNTNYNAIVVYTDIFCLFKKRTRSYRRCLSKVVVFRLFLFVYMYIILSCV